MHRLAPLSHTIHISSGLSLGSDEITPPECGSRGDEAQRTGDRAEPGYSGSRPGKRARLNPERRRRQKGVAAEGQATPVSASTNTGKGEQARKEQDSTVPGLETTP
eukprot:952020-Rhodomonas_salina.2